MKTIFSSDTSAPDFSVLGYKKKKKTEQKIYSFNEIYDLGKKKKKDN